MDMLGLNFRAPLGHCVQVSSDSSLRGSSPPQTAVQIGSLGRNADALFFSFRKYPHCLSLSSSLSVSSLTDGDGFFKGSSSN